MKKKTYNAGWIFTGMIAGIVLLAAGACWADIPAPPANQLLGIADGIFNDMTEAECRVCHDDPAVVGSPSNADRHHLLYGTGFLYGLCSVNKNACLSDADCEPAICEEYGNACVDDDDCQHYALGETCGEVCVGETAVPFIDGNNDGINDTLYGCLNCHAQETIGGVVNFLVERDCLQCHTQVTGESTVHHLTPMAQGLDSPLGNPAVGDCTPCHGTLVDDVGDGHLIPSYEPSLVTPSPSGGDGEPLNSEGNGAGACNYCHSSGTGDGMVPGTDTETGTLVYGNSYTHHSTGLYRSRTGAYHSTACLWCHDMQGKFMRRCETCHGYESLHNIQVDSDNDGIIVVGGELYGYGHIGADDPGAGSDCWGCHGFAFAGAAAPGSGPTAPFISSADPMETTAGTPVQITLSGTAFTNVSGTTQYTSVVELTAGDGMVTGLTPDTVSESTIVVMIPGTIAAGNYEVRAVKNTAVSNPVVISVVPPVVIDETMCASCMGNILIKGSGFGGEPPEGAEEFVNVVVDGLTVEALYWTDTSITVNSSCFYDTVTVNTLYGSATWERTLLRQ